MSETMPTNYNQEAQINLVKNLELLHEYNQITEQIKTANLELFQTTQITNKSLTLERDLNPSLRIQELKAKLQEIGDSMVFGPIDWILYKNKTKQNMNTLAEFVTHCTSGDVICPLRFKFLISQWNQSNDFDILDLNMDLKDFVQTEIFQEIVCNPDFMNQWWDNELQKDAAGNVAKWGVGYKY